MYLIYKIKESKLRLSSLNCLCIKIHAPMSGVSEVDY